MVLLEAAISGLGIKQLDDACKAELKAYFKQLAARLVYGGSYKAVGLSCLCVSIGNVGFNNQFVIRTGIRIWCIRHIVCLVHFLSNRKWRIEYGRKAIKSEYQRCKGIA